MMLGGRPPFYGNDNKEVLISVQRGVYTFALNPFRECSDEVRFRI